MKNNSKKLKILSFNAKWNKFYEYVISQFVQSSKINNEIKESVKDVITYWSENLLNSAWMKDHEFLSIYSEYEKEITQMRIERIDKRVWRKPKNMNNKMKKLLICFCFDEVVAEIFKKVYMN